ncbi:hypothetical protein Bca4012_009005 [Brassica carinata]
MERRLSRDEKGKGVEMNLSQPPRTGRVKAQAPALNERSNKLALTLIGRVTNRSTQKVWSLIPFFTELWKPDGRPVGSDLGNGMFQFQFENEADLNAVLERRPFHYAKWMVILQRWEPTASVSFPSLLPFWIKVQGIPIHLWSEATVKSLAEDFGIFEQAEITDFTVRMRVQVNGLLPLVKTSVLEYPNGDEVAVSFVYERLEKHCSKCLRLDHEVKDCLVAKHEARAVQSQEQSTKDSIIDITRREDRNGLPAHSNAFRFSASKGEKEDRRSYHADRPESQRYDTRRMIEERRRPRSEQEYSSRRNYKEPPKDWQARQDRNRRQYSRQAASDRSNLVRDDARHRLSSKNRNDLLNASRDRRQETKEVTNSSKVGYECPDRRNPLQTSLSPRQNKSLDEALVEVREETPPSDVPIATRIPANQRLGEIGLDSPITTLSGATRTPTPEIPSTTRIPASQRIGTPEDAASPISGRLPANQRLGKQTSANKSTTARLTAKQRLGLSDAEPSSQDPELVPPKRKPGRPPGKKIDQSNAKTTTWTSSKKRRTTGAKPPTVRRTLVSGSPMGRARPLSGTSRASRTNHTSKQKTDTPTSSENQPICHMIPASSRRRLVTAPVSTSGILPGYVPQPRFDQWDQHRKLCRTPQFRIYSSLRVMSGIRKRFG